MLVRIAWWKLLDAESDDFDADAATAALKEFAATVSEDAERHLYRRG